MIIIQLLKDTKYPANYQIIIDSLLGNYAVLRDFFSALHEGHGRPRSVRKSSRLRWKCLSMDCRCSDIANLSAHLPRLHTPPPYLRRMRLSHSQDAGVRRRRLLPFGWGCGCWVQDKADAWPCSPFLQITAHTNPCSMHLWGTLARAVASICAHRAPPQKLIVWL